MEFFVYCCYGFDIFSNLELFFIFGIVGYGFIGLGLIFIVFVIIDVFISCVIVSIGLLCYLRVILISPRFDYIDASPKLSAADKTQFSVTVIFSPTINYYFY